MATRLAVVVVHLASKDEPNPQEAYSDVVAFGNIMESKRASVSSRQTLGEFPEDPSAFITMYPAAFAADDQPIESRVPLDKVTERCNKNVTPCRNSNQHVRGSKAPVVNRKPAELAPVGGLGPDVQALLLKFMFQQASTPAITKDDLRAELPALFDKSQDGNRPPRRSMSSSSLGSASEGGSPPPSFDGGVEPQCLDPLHDKHDRLRKLQEKLGLHEPTLQDDENRDALVAATAPPRLEKPRKRPRENTEVDEEDDIDEEDEVDEEGVAKAKTKGTPRPASVMRKPAASLPRLTKAPKGGSKDASKAVYDALLSKPSKVARPAQSQKPTTHAGGKIYFSKPKSCYRVYLRATDRIEKSVRANPACKSDMVRKFNVACAMIENDKRRAA